MCTFNIIYCILQFGHNDYKDPMTVLDSDDELVLLNGDPTDFYLFEVLCDIMDCTGTYYGLWWCINVQFPFFFKELNATICSFIDV